MNGTSDDPGNSSGKITSQDQPLSSRDRKVCGIVMPIAAMGESYPESHWTRVRLIIQRAIESAGLKPQLVWDNPEIDVIQSAILQNLYENDVVVCDVSNLNPNVMLETGLRLSTKRPTIIITDKEVRPPFDISTIGYIDYQKDLEFNAIDDFIKRLARKIEEVSKADVEGRYHSYIEQFRFETVEPASITVSSEDYIKERLDELAGSVRQLARFHQTSMSTTSRSNVRKPQNEWITLMSAGAQVSEESAALIERKIDEIPYAICHVGRLGNNHYQFDIRAVKSHENEFSRLITIAKDLIDQARADYILS